MSAPMPDYPAAKAGYRTDLDGLRGVAVALVVVYHVWVGRVSGGVDVFLCLSGYFFGTRLLRAACDPLVDYPLWSTFTRLVRRLVPSLVTTVAGCVGLAVIAWPYTRYPELRAQVIASLGYFQNIHLEHSAGDYLAASASTSPLQHLWSMSVQGQFFIGVLLAVWLVAKASRGIGWDTRKTLLATIAAVTAGSFVYATIIVDGTGHGYYDGAARAWELLAGTLAGAVVSRINWSETVRSLAGIIGLALVAVEGFLVNGAAWFPGPAALLPVGATLLLIFSGANQPRGPLPVTDRLLSTGPALWLGTIAYCLYLWHWPLLIMWLSYTGDQHAGVVSGTAVIAVSTVLAWVTARYVESPLRAGRTPPARVRRHDVLHPHPAVSATAIAAAVVAVAATITIAIPAVWAATQPQAASGPATDALDPALYPGARALVDGAPVPDEPVRPSLMEARQDVPVTTWDGCIDAFEKFTITECRFGSPDATRTIALVGGSHSEHWIKALDALGKEHGFAIVTFLKVGCPLSVGMHTCGSWPQRVLDKLVRTRPDYVFTTSTRPAPDENGDEVPEGYLPAWQTLSDAGIPVLAMRDTPWMDYTRDPADCLAMGGTPESCGTPRDKALSKVNPTLDYTARYTLVLPLDMSDAICRPDVCRVVEGNILIYRDSHHISDTYMASMAPELWRQMSAATGWN